jgi:hypothetical protein
MFLGMTAAATWRPKLERKRPRRIRKQFFVVIGSSRIMTMIMGMLTIRVIPWMACAVLAVAVKVDVGDDEDDAGGVGGRDDDEGRRDEVVGGLFVFCMSTGNANV